jgi:hypothetical protein
MKFLIVLLMDFYYMSSFGQVQIINDIPSDSLIRLDKTGDESDFLNCYESSFLNAVFKDSLTHFDFTNKKVGFIMGASKRSKKDYFNMQKKHLVDKKSPVDNGHLHIFSKTQKMESGGYDAVIVYWSKFVTPEQKVVERIRNKK